MDVFSRPLLPINDVQSFGTQQRDDVLALDRNLTGSFAAKLTNSFYFQFWRARKTLNRYVGSIEIFIIVIFKVVVIWATD